MRVNLSFVAFLVVLLAVVAIAKGLGLGVVAR